MDEFRFRCNNYKSNYRKHQRGETCMQQHLYEHFCSSNHNCFISDVLVTFIDKTYSSDSLKREDYWRGTEEVTAITAITVIIVRRFLKLLAGYCHNLKICTF